MAMLAVMSLAFILGYKDRNNWYYFLPVTAVMTVLASSSRGGQLALVGGLLIVSVFILRIRFKTIFVTAVSLFVVFLFIPDEQKERFTSMVEDGSSTSRLEYWAAGLEMMDEYPFLGVGHMAFPLYYADNYSHQKSEDTYLGKRREVAHNTFIQVGSTLGWLGFATYIGMIVFCLYANLKIRKKIKKLGVFESEIWVVPFTRGLDAAMLAYVIGSFFMSVAFYPYIYILMMLSQSVHNLVVKEKNDNENKVFS